LRFKDRDGGFRIHPGLGKKNASPARSSRPAEGTSRAPAVRAPTIWEVLVDWFLANVENPVPTDQQWAEWAVTYGVTPEQIQDALGHMKARWE
jgi:hypothetical protein